MKNRFIGFRLRKQLDDDIHNAVKDLDGDSISEIARTGLRMVLGITSQKVVIVQERPVPHPKVFVPKK